MRPDEPRSGRRLPEALLAPALAALLAGAFLHETLLDPGKVLGALDHPLSSLPWSVRFPSSPPRNPELSDPSVVFDPFLSFLRREVAEGEGLPLWNPHQFCGAPAAGNPQFGHFSPLRSLVHLLPVERSLAFQGAAKIAVALLFTYLLARRLGLSAGSSSLAALGFGLGGYQVLWLLYPLSDVSFLAPAVFLGLEAWFGSGRPRALAGIAASFGLASLGGHPETAAFLGGCAGLHVVCRGVAAAREGRGLRRAAGALLALGIGALLSSVSALPALEYLREGAARDLRAANVEPVRLGGAEIAVLLGLPLSAFLLPRIAARLRPGRRPSTAIAWGTLLGIFLAALGALVLGRASLGRLLPSLLPDFHGNPAFGPDYGGRIPYVQAAAPYAGFATLLLALASFVVAPGARLWKGTFLGAFVLIAGVPLLDPLVRLLLLEPSRAAPIANLAAALLAGHALDQLVGEGRRTLPSVLGLAACGAVAFFGTRFLPHGSLPGPAHPPARGDTGGRLLGILDPKEGSSVGGTRLAFRGWVTGLREGERIEIDLDRGDRNRARAPAPLHPPPFEGAGPGVTRTFSGAFEPLLLPDGRYRILARILDAAGSEAALIDGGVVTLRPSGKVPARTAAFAGALALLLGFAAIGGFRPSLVRAGFAALVGVDLWLFGFDFNPAGNASRVYPTTKVEEYLRQDPDLFGPQRRGRVWTDAGVFPPDSATRLGFLDIRGYDAIDVERFDHFLFTLARNPALFPGLWNLPDLRTEVPAFDLLGVKVVATPHVVRDPRFVLVWEGEVRIYRNRDFRGIALLSPGVQPASEVASVEQVDPARAALVEEEVALGSPFTKGEARIVSHASNRVVLRATLDGEGILTLCENWFPGWEVEVDGRRERLLRTFTTFRGVKLGPGEHEVVFAYRPQSVRTGLTLSLAAAGAILLLACLPRRQRNFA
ncbi:MAG: YfhO family protein [Planctomycetes bacterium]|nr:YfhO family protein [Planctomycetota bacterium]